MFTDEMQHWLWMETVGSFYLWATKSENKATISKLSLCERNGKVHEDHTRCVKFKLNKEKQIQQNFNEFKGKPLIWIWMFRVKIWFLRKKKRDSLASNHAKWSMPFNSPRVGFSVIAFNCVRQMSLPHRMFGGKYFQFLIPSEQNVGQKETFALYSFTWNRIEKIERIGYMKLKHFSVLSPKIIHQTVLKRHFRAMCSSIECSKVLFFFLNMKIPMMCKLVQKL